MADGDTITTTNPDKSLLAGLLSRQEVAAQLGVSVRTLDRWHRLRTGPPRISLGRKRLYRMEAVRLWIEDNEMASARLPLPREAR